jgi:hypothetical protein
MPKWAHILEDQNENLRQQNPNLQNMISALDSYQKVIHLFVNILFTVNMTNSKMD